MNTEIINFAAYLRKEERSAATIEKYIREAGRFLRWLDGRTAGKELALAYKEALMGERTPAGVNGAIAALNCLFSFWGLPECRMRSVKIQRRIFRDEERELTEKEYRRLLTAAKGNRRLLLVMETICATGIRVSELKFFTVEAVRRGRAEVYNKGEKPACLSAGKTAKNTAAIYKGAGDRKRAGVHHPFRKAPGPQQHLVGYEKAVPDGGSGGGKGFSP